jgi:hypothetical protein
MYQDAQHPSVTQILSYLTSQRTHLYTYAVRSGIYCYDRINLFFFLLHLATSHVLCTSTYVLQKNPGDTTRHAAPSPAAASAATCHRRAVQLQPQAHPLAPLCEVQFVTCSGPSLVTNKLTIHVIVVDRAAAAAAAASVAGAVPSSVVHDEPCVLPFSPEVAPHHRELAAAVASVERACRLCVDVSYSLMTVTSMACQF